MDILLKTYCDSVAIKLPDEEEWKRMPLYEKRSVEERLQMLIKDMKNIGRIYNVNLLQLLPKGLKLFKQILPERYHNLIIEKKPKKAKAKK